MPDLASKPVRRVEVRDISFERLLDTRRGSGLAEHPSQNSPENGSPRQHHWRADWQAVALPRLGTRSLALRETRRLTPFAKVRGLYDVE